MVPALMQHGCGAGTELAWYQSLLSTGVVLVSEPVAFRRAKQLLMAANQSLVPSRWIQQGVSCSINGLMGSGVV